MALMTITGAEWNRQGITREVFLIGRYAIKVPRIVYGWRMFLCGLLANMQEAQLAKTGWPELCPVLFAVPGGWLLVMRRAGRLTDFEWQAFDAKKFCVMPAPNSSATASGKIDGRIVAIDYGN